MARKPRIHLPYATYHVMLRGNDGQPIFFSNNDRFRLCLLLQEGVEKFGHTIHAFCFMSNHIHLAVQVKEMSISRIMQNLAFRYTIYINKQQKRIGHLFQGRFKSVLVDDNQYLRELIRYIHLNPVRACLVTNPEKYLWSSHRAYMQIDEFTWLTSDDLLKTFGNNRKEAIVNYEEFILKGINTEVNVDFKSGIQKGFLGDEEFVDKVMERINSIQTPKFDLKDLITKVCEFYHISQEALCSPGKNQKLSQVRALLAVLVRKTGIYSLENLGQILKRDASSLCKLASRFEKKSIHSAEQSADLKRLHESIILTK